MDAEIAHLWRLIGPIASLALLGSATYVLLKGGRLVARQFGARLVWPAAPAQRLALLSFTLVCASSPWARAAVMKPDLRKAQSPRPPWSGSGGFPPPLLPVPTEGASSKGRSLAVHPAIHGRVEDGDGGTPLFPREAERPWESRKASRPQVNGSPREEPLRFQPRSAGQPRKDAAACCPRRYVIRSGDTLWGIAAAVLRTDNPRRIARYWPRIHRANRDVIGPDPNLIRPGEILELPEEASA